jgi:hypothetical protein
MLGQSRELSQSSMRIRQREVAGVQFQTSELWLGKPMSVLLGSGFNCKLLFYPRLG